jgi:ATP-binding cassette subfamily A (ABC1) protein 3
MITGLLKRTSGSIFVAGQTIDQALSKRGSSPDSLWRLIGVTPQFDRVWGELTVEEHLTFYCQLRGIRNDNLPAMVRKIAEEVELDGDAFRTKAMGLSGGMRRRLAIGIALTAQPKILVL